MAARASPGGFPWRAHAIRTAVRANHGTRGVRLYDLAYHCRGQRCHDPGLRLHGPSRAPLGRASRTINISPTVSEVTRPTSRPELSMTPTAGAVFCCRV